MKHSHTVSAYFRPLRDSEIAIFISGYDDADTKGRLSEVPNSYFLNKMSTPEKLKEMIDKHQSK